MAFAEHTIMPISAVYRKPVALHQYVASGRWHQGIPHTVDIFELEGKAVGLVALPNIGHQVPWRIKALVRMTLPRS